MASRARISVVNDTESFLSLIREALSDRFEVATFNGDGLTRERLVESRPDLIMVDLVMRGRELSGWDVIQLCRADQHLSKVPIIVCSADSGQLRNRAVELAMIASLTVLEKPFGIDELDAAVEAALAPPATNGQAAG
jgi:DNA-binding response OmpR family regulator